ncbi:MAG: hypothetical protein LBT93_02435 [Treponema sp.]|jgi:ABC-type transport system involved in cytochrome bd biosynthesis fused ATPase/permease subunit|nr:hypothetical protein [Treponema sp.]
MAAFYYSLAVVSLFTDLSLAFANLQKSYASIVRIMEIETLPIERNSGDVIIEKKETDPVSVADNLNATAFYTALEELFKEKTILLISHRDGEEFLSERFRGKLKILAL